MIIINVPLFICGQYYDSVAISTIHLNRQASEGDFYLDTNKKQYYIGLTNGEVGRIANDTYISGIIQNHLDTIQGAAFAIWAEESAGLTANSFEWAFGDADLSQAGFGIIVPFDCELFAVGLNIINGTGEIEVYRNGLPTGATSGLANAGSILNTLSSPIQINAGDNINFRTLTTTGATNGGKAVAWLRVISKIPTYRRFNGSGTPISTMGNNDDEYLDNTTGDLYIKESGVWVNKLNLRGPAGTTTNKPFIQVTNTLTGDINTGVVGFNWIDISPTTHISNIPTDFTVSSDGVTVLVPGIFKVTIFQYQEGTSGTRNNAGVRITVNGVPEAGYGANSYQRRSNGHDETTASFTKLVTLGAGDKVGIQNEQLADPGVVGCPAGTLVFIVEKL